MRDEWKALTFQTSSGVDLVEKLPGVVRRLAGVENCLRVGNLNTLVLPSLLFVGRPLEMVSQQRGRREETLLVQPLLIVTNLLVQRAPAIVVDRAVADVQHPLAQKAHDLVVDLEVHLDQTQGLGSIQKLQHPVFVQIGTTGQHADGDVLAKRGCASEQIHALVVELGNLLNHDLLERFRQIPLFERFDHPLLSHQSDFTVSNQLADDLGEEERVSLRGVRQIVLKAVWHAETRKDRTQILCNIVGAERLESRAVHIQLVVIGPEKTVQR